MNMILKKRQFTKLNKNKDFSLIELIVVVAIMATLTAVLVPSLTKYVGKARAAKIL